jgi:hypothetical protein
MTSAGGGVALGAQTRIQRLAHEFQTNRIRPRCAYRVKMTVAMALPRFIISLVIAPSIVEAHVMS